MTSVPVENGSQGLTSYNDDVVQGTSSLSTPRQGHPNKSNNILSKHPKYPITISNQIHPIKS